MVPKYYTRQSAGYLRAPKSMTPLSARLTKTRLCKYQNYALKICVEPDIYKEI